MADQSTADLVAGFSAGFARRALTEHGVVSGLGVWLLLALLAPDAPGPARPVLEEALGTDAQDAAARAAALLDDPHPDVAQAVAVWAQQVLLTPAFDRWAASLPGAVARGAMPTQPEADAWTAEQTRGLIQEFPIRMRPLTDPTPTAAVLTSALVTQIRWSNPFDLADEPLSGAFAPARQVLSSTRQHDVYLADTAAAGRVAVHVACSDGGLRVLSVIAEPGRATGDVHRAALEAAAGPASLDLFDLPVGAGHAWTLDESVRRMASRTDRITTAHALLPAWDATTTVDLSDEPWFPAAAATMQSWLAVPDGLEGTQSAVASYDREGFSAAAVTAFGVVGAAFHPSPQRQVRIRHLEVRLDRPYAVVAVADQPRDRSLLDHWNGIPVFSAWVADPR